MKKSWLAKCFLIGVSTFFAWSVLAASPQVVVDVTLNPAGDFKAKTSEVTGAVTKSGSEYTAENVRVKLGKLSTGIELRDKHTLKYLAAKEHPEVILVSAKGKDGKGTGTISIKGIQKEFSGTFKVIDGGQFVLAEFKLNLSDFKITDISYMGVGVEDEVTVHVTIPVAK